MAGTPFMTRLTQLSFVPLLVLVALLTMYTHTTQITSAVEHGELAGLLTPRAAVAQGNKEEKPDLSAKQDKPAGDKAAAVPADKTPPVADAAAHAAARDDDESVDNLTSQDLQVLQQLAARRAELDKRAAQLDQREALITVTEKRVEDKLQQLQQSRTQLEALLSKADGQQDAQIKSLVKIYESMKPQQAATILQQLDMPVLLRVMQEMKEAKAALVLAAMDPQKAKAVTTELMQKRELPKVDTTKTQ